jgi:hypothetical protein
MSAVTERIGIALPEERQAPQRPTTKPRRQPKRRVEPRTAPLAATVGYLGRAALLSLLFVWVSAGVSQYLFEQARHSGISANSRAQAAERALTGLRRDVDRLQSTDRMATWAALNGFTASYLALNEKSQ